MITLLKNREVYFSEFILQVKSELLELRNPTFSEVRKLFASRHWGLLHSFRSKYEEMEDFADLFYSLLMADMLPDRPYIDKKNCIFLLVLFLSTKPANSPCATLGVSQRSNLLALAKLARERNDVELLGAINVLVRKRMIAFGLRGGLRSVFLTKKGVVRRDTAQMTPEFCGLSVERCLLTSVESGAFAEFSKCASDYLQMKDEFLEEFVANDDNELIDFDAKTSSVTKRTAKDIGFFKHKHFEEFQALFGVESPVKESRHQFSGQKRPKKPRKHQDLIFEDDKDDDF